MTAATVGGGPNITISSVNASHFSISGKPGMSMGVSTLGNSLGSTGVTGTRVVLAGGNNVTLSQSTDANGATITVSGANVGGAQTGISSIAASNTTYTSGGITITGSNMVTVKSTTGQGIVIDATQTVQTQGVISVGVSTGGNTAGNTSVNSGQRMVLAGAGMVTLSQATGAGSTTISISATQSVQAETQTFVGGIVGSNATYTSGTVTITGVGGGVTVSSNTGQRIDISVAAPVAQTVQTQNVHNVTLSGNTAGVMAQISSGTMTLAGGNNITVSQNGNAVTISGANVGGAQTAISGLANSETTYTSGSVTLSALGAITIRSTTGQHFQFSVAAQSAQTGISGLANSQTTYTSGTVSLSELGAVTIRSTTGNQFQISVNAQTVQTQGITADELSIGVSTGGNTSGNTTVQTGQRFVLVGTNGITLSQGTGAGSTTLTISGVTTAAQTVQTQNMVAISASNTLYSSGTVTITGSNMVTVKSSAAGQGVIIDATQSVQTQSRFNLTLSGNSTSAGGGYIQISSGVMTLAGGNNVTLSQDGNAVTISGAAAGGAQTAISGLANSETTYTSGSVTLSALANITIRSTTGQHFQFSVAAQSVQTQGITADELSIGVSNVGNTAGNTTVQTGQRMVLAGAGMVTLSQATGAGSTTVSVSATQSVQTQNMVAVSLSGNSTSAGAGYALLSSGTMILAGGPNITLSQDGSKISISGGAGGGGAFSLGVSNLGNTAGSTGISGTRVVLVALDRMTLSQSTDANGATISFDEALVTRSRFAPFGINAPFASGNYLDAFMKIVPFSVNAGELVTASRVDVMGSFSIQTTNNATNTLNGSQSVSIGIYSKNGNTLSLYSSGSQSYSHSNTSNANTSIFNGIKNQSVPLNLSLTPGEWWLATWRRTSSNMLGVSEIKMHSGIVSVGLSGSWGQATNSSYTWAPGWGIYSNASFSTGMPSSIAMSDVKGGITQSHEINVIPYALMLNGT